MGIKDFAISMLKRDLKQFKLYIVSIVISIAVIFNLFNLLYNGQFIQRGNMMGNLDFIFVSMITFMTMGIAIMFVFFTNRYFLIKKTKEIGISLISGRNIYEVGGMIEIQNCIILGIGLVLGVFAGILTMPIFLFFMYSALDVTGSYFNLSLEGLGYTTAVIVLEFIWIILINFGYVYRQEVKDLLVNDKMMYSPDRRKFKFKPWVYLVAAIIPIAILPVVLFNGVSKSDFSQIVNFVVPGAAFALVGVFKYYIPFKFQSMKSKSCITNRYKLLAFSNLEYSIQKSALVILGFGMVSISLISFLSNGLKQSLPEGFLTEEALSKITAATNSLIIVSYIIILILVGITFIYKVAIEAENRKTNFKQYKILGYTTKELVKVMAIEMKYFYLLVSLLPLLYILILVAAQVYAATLTITSAALIVCVYLLVMIITYLISHYVYKKIILGYVERG